jgi:hypothetical protein
MQGDHVYNFDNYANTIGRYLPSADLTAYKNCLWTGVAIVRFPPGVSLDIVKRGGVTVPAMPSSLFSDELWDKLRVKLEIVDAQGSDYLKTSRVKKWQVNNFPPKPKPEHMDAADYADEVELLTNGESADGLGNVYPCGILEHNTSSNLGLCRVMKHVMKEHDWDGREGDKYVFLMSDINIYHRIQKVCAECVVS